MRNRNGDARTPTVPQGRHCCVAADTAARTTQPSYPNISETNEKSGPDQSDEAGLRLFELVCRAAGRALGKGDGHTLQRRSNAAPLAPGRFFGSSSQAHPQRETQRSRARCREEIAGPSKNKAITNNAPRAL